MARREQKSTGLNYTIVNVRAPAKPAYMMWVGNWVAFHSVSHP